MQPPNVRLLWHFELWFLTEKTFLNYRHCACFPENPSIQCNSLNIKGNGNGRHMRFSTSIYDLVSCGPEWEQTGPAMSWPNMCWADEHQMKDFRNVTVAARGNVFDLFFVCFLLKHGNPFSTAFVQRITFQQLKILRGGKKKKILSR